MREQDRAPVEPGDGRVVREVGDVGERQGLVPVRAGNRGERVHGGVIAGEVEGGEAALEDEPGVYDLLRVPGGLVEVLGADRHRFLVRDVERPVEPARDRGRELVGDVGFEQHAAARDRVRDLAPARMIGSLHDHAFGIDIDGTHAGGEVGARPRAVSALGDGVDPELAGAEDGLGAGGSADAPYGAGVVEALEELHGVQVPAALLPRDMDLEHGLADPGVELGQHVAAGGVEQVVGVPEPGRAPGHVLAARRDEYRSSKVEVHPGLVERDRGAAAGRGAEEGGRGGDRRVK